MKIIIIGDIYGKTGRETIQKLLPDVKAKYCPDCVVANGENVTAGNGLSGKHANGLKNSGIDILTTGNHVFSRLDWPDLMKKHDFVLRPHNLATVDAPGTGFRVFNLAGSMRIAVINLAGRVFMEPARCPFKTFDQLYESIEPGIPVIVDFHAEATSEKLAFSWHVNGRASVVAGTHTHVQTSDERILPGGFTACITDLGMTGPVDGVIGVDRDTITGRFVRGYSDKFVCAAGPGKIEGLFVELADEDRKIIQIERFRFQENG